MSVVMRQEIAQQPDVLRLTLEKLDAAKPQIEGLLSTPVNRVLFIARGTSDNVAGYGLFLVPLLAGIEAYSISPSIINSYDVSLDLQGALVIAISQSGETQEIVKATRTAKSMGAKVIAITNNFGSSLDAVADFGFATPAGEELAVPATKTYSAALLALAGVLATLFKSQELLSAIKKVPELVQQQLSNWNPSPKLVEILGSSTTAVYAGRGLTMAAAFEGALKLKETSGINAIGTSVADLVHGPIAALSESVPLVLLSATTTAPVYAGLKDLEQRAKALGSPIITIGDFAEDDLGDIHVPISLDVQPEMLGPLLMAAPCQLIAAGVSDFKGLDADNPLGLRKVTQTT